MKKDINNKHHKTNPQMRFFSLWSDEDIIFDTNSPRNKTCDKLNLLQALSTLSHKLWKHSPRIQFQPWPFSATLFTKDLLLLRELNILKGKVSGDRRQLITLCCNAAVMCMNVQCSWFNESICKKVWKWKRLLQILDIKEKNCFEQLPTVIIIKVKDCFVSFPTENRILLTTRRRRAPLARHLWLHPASLISNNGKREDHVSQKLKPFFPPDLYII